MKRKAISLFPTINNKISIQQNLLYEEAYVNASKKNKVKQDPSLPREPKGIQRMPKKKVFFESYKKVALMLSYCGTGYYGLQINPDVPTIELDLFKALACSGYSFKSKKSAVIEQNAMDPNKVQYSRCARTDRGVHAAGNVVALKMLLLDDIVEKINKHLPDQIRVLGYARVNNSFNAKDMCDSRIYEYLLPTYCLAAVDPKLYPWSKVALDSGINVENCGRTLYEELKLDPVDNEGKEFEKYRIDAKTLSKLREIFSSYIGTKSHHNFTVGKTFNDKSAKRYITKFDASEPFMKGGLEWISCKIHGQSFMLHQIRKLIGFAILMIRTKTPTCLLEKVFEKQRVNIPKAPALGLLLEQPIFEKYNQNIGNVVEDRNPIEFETKKDQVEEFKQKWIYQAICDTETSEYQFAEWNRSIDQSSDSFGWYLNHEGDLNVSNQPPNLFARVSIEEAEEKEQGGDE